MEPSDIPESHIELPKNLAEALDLRRRLGLEVPIPSRPGIRLATALAERLDAVVPAPFRVRAEDGHVSQFIGNQWCASSDVAGILDQDSSDQGADELESEDWPFVDRVASICYN